MTEYRTKAQFDDIIDSAVNGNWKQAGQDCVKYGFYSRELVDFMNEAIEELGDKPYAYFDNLDIALIIEIATIIRYSGE